MMIGTVSHSRIAHAPPSVSHASVLPSPHRMLVGCPRPERSARHVCAATRTRGRVERTSEMPDYWAALEIERGAGAESVKAAYRRLQKVYHPDNAQVHPRRRIYDSSIRMHRHYRYLDNHAQHSPHPHVNMQWRWNTGPFPYISILRKFHGHVIDHLLPSIL